MPPDHRAAAVNATPLVRRLANQYGVSLSAITPTGVGGRIRKQDVLAAAPVGRPASSPAAAVGRFRAPIPTDVTSLAGDAALVSAARAANPEPTLFATGDLPPFTASGIAPEALLQVPWQARHALAAAPTTAAAYAIVADYADLNPEAASGWAYFGGHAGHPGNRQFIDRMEDWLCSTTAPGSAA